MTTHEIVATFKEMYDANVSPSLISKVTGRRKRAGHWRGQTGNRMRCTPIVYRYGLHCRQSPSGMARNQQSRLPALGINTEGQKELLGMWLAENEGEKFWLSVLTELKTRGVQDILIARVDGLKGFRMR